MDAGAKVCLGVIAGAKGLKGAVRIKTFTAVPQDIAAYGPLRTADGRAFTLSVAGAGEGVVTARIAGVDGRAAAEALKGLALFVDRAALPEPEDGTFYQADLVGLDVAFAGGAAVGKVVAFHDFGGGDVMEVAVHARADKTVLLPFTADVVARVDLAGGRVIVNPAPGLFDEASKADGHAA